MNVTLLKPIGYCQGVYNAINKALEIRSLHPDKNIYVLGQLIHNTEVINHLLNYGITTVDVNYKNMYEQLDSFSSDDILIFTAHGHDKRYEDYLKKKKITFYDTTCDKVHNNFNNVIKNLNRGIIFIGKENHPETIAALSISKDIVLYDIENGIDYSKIKTENPLIINQTTLSLLELKQIFNDIKKHLPKAEIMDEICNATKIRQENIIKLDKYYDLIIVVGSKESSNTDKLYQLALSTKKAKKVIKINNYLDLLNENLEEYNEVLITSGTSTPIKIINELSIYLRENYNGKF